MTPGDRPPAAAAPATGTAPARSARPHVAARLEDWLGERGAARARRWGWRLELAPFVGYGTPREVHVLGRLLWRRPRPPGRDDATERGWRRFLTTAAPGAVVEVTVGGRVHRVTADRGGYLDAVLPADLPDGRHELPATLVPGTDGRSGPDGSGRVAGTLPVVVVPDGPRFGLVSDIDDTVMVTNLPRPLLAAWNSFGLREAARRPVPGMADCYRELLQGRPDPVVVYLSTGPWNAEPMLRRFLAGHGFPSGPLLLTDWGPTNTGWFRSGQEHKRAWLARLARDLPDVRWLLVGDDGQHDPQLYAEFARTSPAHVLGIAVRELTATQSVLAHGSPGSGQAVPEGTPERGRGSGADVPVPVVAGPDGSTLLRRLADRGLVGRPRPPRSR
jgi:phosphatidate phosphatase APP1